MSDRLWAQIQPPPTPSFKMPGGFVVSNTPDSTLEVLYRVQLPSTSNTNIIAVGADKNFIYFGVTQGTPLTTGIYALDRTNATFSLLINSSVFGNVSITGIAVGASKLYIAVDNGIWTSNLDGTNPQKIVTTAGNGPRSICTDDASFIWFTKYNGGLGWKVDRCSLNGSGVTDIVNLVNAGGSNSCEGIAQDGTFLYWPDGTRNSIGRSNLDGSSPNLTWLSVGAVANAIPPTGMAVDATNIYWTSLKSPGFMYFANKTTPGPVTLYEPVGNQPQSVTILP